MKQEKTPPNKPMRKGPNFARLLYMAYLCICMSVCFAAPASAATIWEKASEIMQDVYTQILTISTIAAIVTASVALLMMNFSRSGRTVCRGVRAALSWNSLLKEVSNQNEICTARNCTVTRTTEKSQR